MTQLTALVVSLLIVRISAPSLGGQVVQAGELRGLALAQLLVRNTSPDATGCGVRTADVELSVARPLSDAGIKVIPPEGRDDRAVLVVAEVLVLRSIFASMSKDFCVAFVRVSVVASVSGRLSYQPSDSKTGTLALLYEQLGTASGPSRDLGQLLNSVVRESVDRFATKVRLANQK